MCSKDLMIKLEFQCTGSVPSGCQLGPPSLPWPASPLVKFLRERRLRGQVACYAFIMQDSNVCQYAKVVLTKYHRLNSFSNRIFSLTLLMAGSPKIKVWTGLDFSDTHFLGLQTTIFLQPLHMFNPLCTGRYLSISFFSYRTSP